MKLGAQPSSAASGVAAKPGGEEDRLSSLLNKATVSSGSGQNSESSRAGAAEREQQQGQDKGRNLLRLLSQPEVLPPSAETPVAQDSNNTAASVQSFFLLAGQSRAHLTPPPDSVSGPGIQTLY